MSKENSLFALAVLITAVLSVTLTALVDQKRWEAHERQQQEELQQRMLQGENNIRRQQQEELQQRMLQGKTKSAQ